jgi:hypothetical protein
MKIFQPIITGSSTITGSLTVTGSINATSFTGSLLGSSSYALTASYALNGGGSSTPAFPYTGSAIITGSLTVTGSISSTTLTGSGDRLVLANSQGLLTASNQTIIQTYIDPTGTVAGYLNNTGSWSISGSYTGTIITGTYQGQKHYNVDYFFEAVDDNLWIRLIRG